MTHEIAIKGGFLPDMSEDERERFTPLELMLYKHALEYKWTAEELKKVIAMLRNPEFDSKEVDPDLHKRMNKAVQDGRIRCFDMQEGPADGDQDLNFWTRQLEDLVREIMEDPVFSTSVSKWTWTRQERGCLGARQMQACHSKLDN